jgi:hypothetical protein
MTTVTAPTVTGMICQQCGEPLPTYRRGWSTTKMRRRKYCSLSCAGAGRKGRRQNHKTPTGRAGAPPEQRTTPVHCPACGRRIAADDTLPATVLAAVKANHRRYCGRDTNDEDGW